MGYTGTLRSPKGFDYEVTFDDEPTEQDINEVIADLDKREQDTLQPKSEAAINAIGRGAASIVPSTIGGIGAVAGMIPGVDPDNEIRQAGKELQGVINEAIPVNPAYENDWGVKIPSAVGQGISQGALAVASGGSSLLPLSTAFLSGAGQGADVADELGLTGARRAGMITGYSLAEGGVESISGIGALKKFTPSFLEPGSSRLLNAGKVLLGEGVIEEPLTGFLQDVTQDVSVLGTDKPMVNPLSPARRIEEAVLGIAGAAPFAGVALAGHGQKPSQVINYIDVDGKPTQLPPDADLEALKANNIPVRQVVVPNADEQAAIDSAPTAGAKDAVQSVIAGAATTPSVLSDLPDPIIPYVDEQLVVPEGLDFTEDIPLPQPIPTNEEEKQGQGLEGQQGLLEPTPSVETITPTSEGSVLGGGIDLGTSTEGEATGSTAPPFSILEGQLPGENVNTNVSPTTVADLATSDVRAKRNIDLGAFKDRVQNQQGQSQEPEQPSIPVTPPAAPITVGQAIKRTSVVHKLSPANVEVVNRPKMKARGWFDPTTRKVVVNTAWIGSESELDEVIFHEHVHRIERDQSVQKDIADVMSTVPKETLKMMEDELLKQGYNFSDLPSEKAAVALSQMANTFRKRPAFRRFVARVKAWSKQVLGITLNQRDAEAIAARVIAQSMRQNRSGDFVADRAGNQNVRKSVEGMQYSLPAEPAPEVTPEKEKERIVHGRRIGGPATPDTRAVTAAKNVFDSSAPVSRENDMAAKTLAYRMMDPVEGRKMSADLMAATGNNKTVYGALQDEMFMYSLKKFMETRDRSLFDFLRRNINDFYVLAESMTEVGKTLAGRARFPDSAFLAALDELTNFQQKVAMPETPAETTKDIRDEVNQTKLDEKNVSEVGETKVKTKTGKETTIRETIDGAVENTKKRKAKETEDKLSEEDAKATKALKDLYTELTEGPKNAKVINEIKELVKRFLNPEDTRIETTAALADEINALGVSSEITDKVVAAADKVRVNRELIVAEKAKGEVHPVLEYLYQKLTEGPGEASVKEPVRKAVDDYIRRKTAQLTTPQQLRATIEKLGVPTDVATQIVEAADSVLNNKDLSHAQRLAEGSKGTLKGLETALINASAQQQQDPTWVRDTAIEYFMQSGLTRQRAEQAADLYHSAFANRLADAILSAAKKVAEGSAPWKKKQKNGNAKTKQKMLTELERFRRAIRLGLTNPNINWQDRMAQDNGWKGFSPAQHYRLAEIDSELKDPKIMTHEKAALVDEMQDIISKATVPDSLAKTVLASYTASALSGLSTLTVQSSPHIGLALTEFPVDLVTSGDPVLAINAFKQFLKSTVAVTAHSIKTGVYPHEAVEHMRGIERPLERLLDRAKVDMQSTNPLTKAKGFLKAIVAWQKVMTRIMNSVDEGFLAAAEDYKRTLFSARALKRLGWTREQAGKLIRSSMESRRAEYERAVGSGVSVTEADLQAGEVFRQNLFADLAGTPMKEEGAQDIFEGAQRDAVGAVGRLTEGVDPVSGEGFLRTVISRMISSMGKGLSESGLEGLKTRMAFGFIAVPFRSAMWYSQFTPYEYVRLMLNYGHRNKGWDIGRYEQSMATEEQRYQRLRNANFGSLLAPLIYLLASSTGDDDAEKDEWKIFVTGKGPEDKILRDAWEKKFKPWSLTVKTGKSYTTFNTNRAFEAFAWPLAVSAAYDDMKLKHQGVASRNPVANFSEAAEMFGKYLGSLNQRSSFQGINKIANIGKSVQSGDAGMDFANLVAFSASALIPWKGMANSLTRSFSDPVDRKTLEGAIYSNLPVVGPMLGKPALNSLADPILDQTPSGKMYSAGSPVVLRANVDGEAMKAYNVILKHGRGPAPARQSDFEKIYGAITPNQLYDLNRVRGQLIKAALVRDADKLMKMDFDKYGDYLEKLSRTVNPKAAQTIGLKRLK